jgi:hypothetical protein
MARHEVIVTQCDQCGTEDTDPSKFLHVVISELPVGKKKPQIVSERDLCKASCVGLPGVNRGK